MCVCVCVCVCVCFCLCVCVEKHSYLTTLSLSVVGKKEVSFFLSLSLHRRSIYTHTCKWPIFLLSGLTEIVNACDCVHEVFPVT